MKAIIVQDNQRGLLFRHGKFVRMLEPGRHWLYGGRQAEILPVREPLHSALCPLEQLLEDPAIARAAASVEVADQQLALHYVNGVFQEALRKGRHAFWNLRGEHTFQLVDTASPEVGPEVPAYVLARLPSALCQRVDVEDYQKARLYFDHRLQRVLDGGTYHFWRNGVLVEADMVDTRLTQLNVTGQEILTRDKVSVRINYVCSYRITDWVKVLTEIDDYAEQLHVAVQLALREFVGVQRLDELLDSKEQLSAQVLVRLREKAPALYLEITDGGVKDIILPGEIREIMNTVLVAEKRAQANVITRREEVASTRSLLNTARLMEENRTLMRLKEMEYIERICENVGSISLSGNGDLLAQLQQLLERHAS